MEYIRLGKTNLVVSRTALDTVSLARAVKSGALSNDETAELLHAAYEGEVNFFHFPSLESPSSKISSLFASLRPTVYFAFGSDAKNGSDARRDAERMLAFLQTDYLDLYQIRDPGFMPEPGGSDGLYDTVQLLKDEGKIRHTGFITDNITRLKEAVCSPLYETVQFPFNFLVSDDNLDCTDLCLENDTGFIASRPLAGKRIENIPLAFGFFRGKENVVPMWRIETKEALTQILYFEQNPPIVDEQFLKDLEEEKQRLLLNPEND
ncbi:aldo/keto reductase [Treponema sp. HNW]|uniref:aldo/keto reductase n=1 Tax=Treponema sp. HNW TaxID=3116654 RepID=UPI003D137600